MDENEIKGEGQQQPNGNAADATDWKSRARTWESKRMEHALMLGKAVI